MKRRILSKTTSFHTLFIKKKARNGAVLNGTVGFLLPLVTRNRGRRRFFLPLFSPTSLPLKHQKDIDQGPPLAQNFPRVGVAVEGRQHSGRPVLFLPYFFLIKIGEHKSRRRRQQGREEKRREEKKEGKNEEQKRGGEKERKRKKKQRRERKKKEKHRRPPQQQHPHRQHCEQLVDVRLVTPTVTFLLRSPSVVHAACE